MEKKKVGQTETEWQALWQTSDGKAFKAALALMFAQCRPNTVPSEGDARAYWWNVRDIVDWVGVGAVLEGMQSAANSTKADEWRPSAGMVRAQSEKAALSIRNRDRVARALAPKTFVPPTEEQLAQIREDIRRMPRGPVPQLVRGVVARVAGAAESEEPSAYGELGGGVA